MRLSIRQAGWIYNNGVSLTAELESWEVVLLSFSFSLRDVRRELKVFTCALLLLLLVAGTACSAPRTVQRPKVRDSYDVVVAGGGMGGSAAAIQAARLGASVLVVEPSGWIGGQATAAGVSTMDDLSRIKSGLYLEFFSRI